MWNQCLCHGESQTFCKGWLSCSKTVPSKPKAKGSSDFSCKTQKTYFPIRVGLYHLACACDTIHSRQRGDLNKMSGRWAAIDFVGDNIFFLGCFPVANLFFASRMHVSMYRPQRPMWTRKERINKLMDQQVESTFHVCRDKKKEKGKAVEQITLYIMSDPVSCQCPVPVGSNLLVFLQAPAAVATPTPPLPPKWRGLCWGNHLSVWPLHS